MRNLIGAAALCSTFLLGGCGGAGGSLLGGLGGNTGGCFSTHVFAQFPDDRGIYDDGSDHVVDTVLFDRYGDDECRTGSDYRPPVFGSPGAIPVLYLGLTFSTTEYASGLPSLTITLPSTLAGSTHSFYVAANSGGSWSGPLLGPVTPNGGVLTFSAGGGNTTFDAGDEEELVVYAD